MPQEFQDPADSVTNLDWFIDTDDVVKNRLGWDGNNLNIVANTVVSNAFVSNTIVSNTLVSTTIVSNTFTTTTLIYTANAFSANYYIVGSYSGEGIKLDMGQPEYGWRDIIGDVAPKFTGAGSPTLESFISGGIWKGWFYTTNDLSYCIYHIPHDYVPGSNLFLHLHWGHNGTAISGQLKVDYSLLYAKGFNQSSNGNFSTETKTALTVSTPNIATIPQYRHRVDEIQISTPGGSATMLNTNAIEVDGLVLIGVKANIIPTITGSVTTQNKPCFFTLDIHYQSTNIATKNKAPSFYA